MKIERLYADQFEQMLHEMHKETKEEQALMPPEEQAKWEARKDAGLQDLWNRVNHRRYIYNETLDKRFLHAANMALDVAKLFHLNVLIESGNHWYGTIELSAKEIVVMDNTPQDQRDMLFTLLMSSDSFYVRKTGEQVRLHLSYARYDEIEEA